MDAFIAAEAASNKRCQKNVTIHHQRRSALGGKTRQPDSGQRNTNNHEQRNAPAAGRVRQVDLRGLGLDGNVVRQADVTRRDVVVRPGARDKRLT